MMEVAIGPEVNSKIEAAEARLLHCDQVDCKLQHFFAPGLYIRQITMPAGSLVVGHLHRTEHPNIILKGEAIVSMNGEVQLIEAGMTFNSGVNTRKVLLVVKEMVWQTVHCIDTSDLGDLSQLTPEQKEEIVDRIRPDIIRPSRVWEDHKIATEMNQLITKEAE